MTAQSDHPSSPYPGHFSLQPVLKIPVPCLVSRTLLFPSVVCIRFCGLLMASMEKDVENPAMETDGNALAIAAVAVVSVLQVAESSAQTAGTPPLIGVSPFPEVLGRKQVRHKENHRPRPARCGPPNSKCLPVEVRSSGGGKARVLHADVEPDYHLHCSTGWYLSIPKDSRIGGFF